MSELTSSKRHGNLGRTLLWVAIGLSVLLLGFVTALSIRANPYYSDAVANGISKYQFLEECREEIGRPDQPTLVQLQNAFRQRGQLPPGQSLHADFAGGPSELVRNVLNVPGGGWALNQPVSISIRGQTAVLFQLAAQCAHDKAQRRTVAQIQLPNQ